MTRHLPLLALTFGLALSGCGTPLPDLDARLTDTSRQAAYPTLVPLDPLLVSIDALGPPQVTQASLDMQARVDDLRRRAAALRRLSIS